MALEQAIEDDFDDLASHMAYADYLAEQGDPRGELIQVQLALEEGDRPEHEREQLQKREEALLKQHLRTWLGDLAVPLHDEPVIPESTWTGPGETQFTFSRGWIDTLTIGKLNVELAQQLAASSQLRMLRELTIQRMEYYAWSGHEGELSYEPDEEMPAGLDYPQLLPLARASLGNVKRFIVGDMDDGQCVANGYGIPDLIVNMPKLEELRLFAHDVDTEFLFSYEMPHLRVLQIYHCHEYPLEDLARNKSMGNLTHLLCHPHALEPGDEGAYIGLAELRAIVRSKKLKSLSHLQLRVADFADQGCKEIVRSGILKRLKWLDLRSGGITDEGALTLVGCDDLDRLEHLDLERNYLSVDGIREIKAVLPHAIVEDQIDPRDYPDFDLYLYEGDME